MLSAADEANPPVRKAARWDLRRRVHWCHPKSATRGHFGIRRTKDQVLRRFYWTSWKDDTLRFVQTCPKCNEYHRGKLRRQGPLRPVLTYRQFSSVLSCPCRRYELGIRKHNNRFFSCGSASNPAGVAYYAILDSLVSQEGVPPFHSSPSWCPQRIGLAVSVQTKS